MVEAASTRKYIIGGNWKSNGTVDFVRQLIQETLNPMQWDEEKVEVVVCPLTIHIAAAKAMLKSSIQVGSQNISCYKNGAFTGEISAD